MTGKIIRHEENHYLERSSTKQEKTWGNFNWVSVWNVLHSAVLDLAYWSHSAQTRRLHVINQFSLVGSVSYYVGSSTRCFYSGHAISGSGRSISGKLKPRGVWYTVSGWQVGRENASANCGPTGSMLCLLGENVAFGQLGVAFSRLRDAFGWLGDVAFSRLCVAFGGLGDVAFSRLCVAFGGLGDVAFSRLCVAFSY
jgi:hypothetical protein